MTIPEIEEDLERDFSFHHIDYKDKIMRARSELEETNPTNIMKRGRNEWDNILGGIYGGKIYVIGADTGVGKSTFVNQVCNNVSNQGFKVIKYSLEDRLEDIGKEEIYYIANRIRYKENKKPFDWIKFVNNEYNDEEFWHYTDKAVSKLIEKNNLLELDKKRQVSIEDLIYLMEDECNKGAKLFAIDHLHYFDMSTGGERHDLKIQSIMHDLNEIARKRDIAIMLVAHYKKNKAYGTADIPCYDDFKDGSAIKQVANIIIQITRDIQDTTSQFYITKIRGPIRPPKYIETKFNIKTFEYDFTKSDQQRESEKKFI